MVIGIHLRAGLFHRKLDKLSLDLGAHALLAHVQGKGFGRHFRSGLSAKCFQGLVPVQHGLVRFVSVQVQIEFLHLPLTVFTGRFGALSCVCGQCEAFFRRVRDHLVLRMAVFSVLAVGHHDLRPEPAVHFRNPVDHLLLSARVLIGILDLAGLRVVVAERPELRIVPDPQSPQPVQRFASPGGIAVGQVRHRHLSAALRAVFRDCAAGKQQFVVRMRNQHQQVCLGQGLLPALDPVRDFALAESENLIEAHHVLLLHCGEDPDLLQSLQFKERVMIPWHPAFRHRYPAVPALFLDHIVVRHLLEAQVQTIDRLV